MSFVDTYTEFVFTEDAPEKADIIFIPGSSEGVLAIRAAQLWKEQYAPMILPSGRFGKNTGHFDGPGNYETEWEYLHAILRKEGVPEEAIWKEDQATFTYENAIYSRKVTDAAGLSVKRRWFVVRHTMPDGQNYTMRYVSRRHGFS